MTAQERADIKAKINRTIFAIILPLSTIPTMLDSPNHSVSIIQSAVKVRDRIAKCLQAGEFYPTIFTPSNFIAAKNCGSFFTKTDHRKL